MEELVNKLAELQAEQKTAIDGIAADPVIAEYTAAIVELEKQVSKGRDALYDLESAYGVANLKKLIDETKAQLIDDWDGKQKTIKCEAWTLSFTTTGSLKITDGNRLMELLIEKAPIADIVSKYIKGFKLTGVKKFVDVHNVQTGVASMEYKTNVRLKTE